MILVTGGTGFVGRHLVERFAVEGRQVRILSRTPGRTTLPAGASWAQGDLGDAASLRAALAGVNIVVHAAAILPDRHTADNLEAVNAVGTAALASAARDTGIARFVHVSSAGVYGDGSTAIPHRETDAPRPGNAYERSKVAAERALAVALSGSAVSWTVLRPQGLYAADRPATATLFRDVATRSVWVHGSARMVVHPTHIDDLVSAIMLVIDRTDVSGETFNVAGERALELRELVAMIGARVGHTPRQFTLPRAAGTVARTLVHGWSRFGTPPAILERQSREWINRSVSIDRARERLGFTPVSLDAGLDRTAAQLRIAA